MMETIITVDNVSKSFGKGDLELKVLDNANMTIQKGEFVSLMGPSGSGKSTLLYLIGGLDRDYTGNIIVCGDDIGKVKEKKLSEIRLNKIGFIFQFYNLVQNLSVEDNILLPLKVSGKYNNKTAKKLNEILHITKIADKRKAMPAKLSGGQQQRVAIARAIAQAPPILLADEPTGNLDSGSSKEIINIIKRLYAEGRTVIVITHDPGIARQAKRIITISDGHIVSDIINPDYVPVE